MSGQLPSIIPSPLPADLLEQLAQHQQTAGLAKLTQRLISALKIPMHSRASNDQSFGGVSDLSNRGNFDRLLLSELAHDDLSLMVRLANNEALYLRREELPSKHKRQRFILIDTSIKMWGTPRIYAIATALAAINNSKATAYTFVLQGSHYSEISLLSATGIQTALNQLSPALDSAEALTAFTKEFPLNRQQEYFLITDEQLFYTPSFQYAFANLRNAHGFLATVSRTGQLQLFQYTGAGRRLLHSILLDLPELLETVAVRTPGEFPAFFNEKPAPLHFPANKIKHDRRYQFEAFGVISITYDNRVLYNPNNTTGAREIISHIITGRYYFGDDGVSMIYILAAADESEQLILYKIATAALITKTIECRNVLPKDIITISWENKEFLIDAADKFYAINPEAKNPDALPVEPYSSKHYFKFQPGIVSRFINNGYSTINKTQQVTVRNGLLWLDGKEIAVNHDQLWITDKSTTKKKGTISAKRLGIVGLPDVRYQLTKYRFGNGSEAFIDSRGLLHLRAAKSIEELTIVLISGKPTACWSSDGHVCGSPYFTGDNPNKIPVQEFYNRYIQSFIHALS